MALRIVLFALAGVAAASYDASDMGGGMDMSTSPAAMPSSSMPAAAESYPATAKMSDELSSPTTTVEMATATLPTTTTILTSVYTDDPMPESSTPAVDMDSMPGMPMGTGTMPSNNSSGVPKIPVSTGSATNQVSVRYLLQNG